MSDKHFSEMVENIQYLRLTSDNLNFVLSTDW